MSSKNIGHYELIKEIGRGGMATVYLARDKKHKRLVAYKLLAVHFQDDPTFHARFKREVITFARLEHDAIVPLYDSDDNPEEDSPPYLVMRFMKGGDLQEKIKNGAIDLDEIVPILSRIAAALDFAHAKGVIHRDIKPSNILFDDSNNAYLTDFGITKLIDSENSTQLTLTGAGVIGTPAYMSPEQSLGDVVLNSRSDIYSLGVVLFEMITGQLPFEGTTPTRQLLMHINHPIPRILEIDSDLPPLLEPVIQKVLAKKPADRYQTAQDLASDFASAISNSKVKATMPTAAAVGIKLKNEQYQEVEYPSQFDSDPTDKRDEHPKSILEKNKLILIGICLLLFLCVSGMLSFAVFSNRGATIFLPPPSSPPPSAAATANPTALSTPTSTRTPDPTLTKMTVPTSSPTEPPTSIPLPPTPTTPPTPLPQIPMMRNAIFCATECLDNGSNAVTSLPAGSEQVYMRWEYENVPFGASYTRSWHSNGEPWVIYSCTWDGPNSGIERIHLWDTQVGLRSGIWEVTVSVDGALVLQESITVDGNYSAFIPVSPLVQNKCH